MSNTVQIPYYPLVWMEKHKRHMDLCIYTTRMQMVIVTAFLLIVMFTKSTNSSQLPLDLLESFEKLWKLLWRDGKVSR